MPMPYIYTSIIFPSTSMP